MQGNQYDLHKMTLMYSQPPTIKSTINWIKSYTTTDTAETLALEFNELQGYVPPELCNLNKLTLLRLDHNDFNGEIPRTFGLLTCLKELDEKHCS